MQWVAHGSSELPGLPNSSLHLPEVLLPLKPWEGEVLALERGNGNVAGGTMVPGLEGGQGGQSRREEEDGPQGPLNIAESQFPSL